MPARLPAKWFAGTRDAGAERLPGDQLCHEVVLVELGRIAGGPDPAAPRGSGRSEPVLDQLRLSGLRDERHAKVSPAKDAPFSKSLFRR